MTNSLLPKNLSADQAFSRNSLLTKAQLVAHIIVSAIIFMISAAVITNTNLEAKLNVVADFQGLSTMKWLALISCVLALAVIGLCGVLLVTSFIGEPSTLKRTFVASFEAKVLRVFEFTTSGTVLYGGLLAASLAQAVLGLLMSRSAASIPSNRVWAGKTTYRTAIKDGPIGVAVLGLLATAVTGFGMWYRTTLRDNYNQNYQNPVVKAVGAVGGAVSTGYSTISGGINRARSWFSNTPPAAPIIAEE